MKIIYTKHAAGKFQSLRIIGWKFNRADVREAINNPDHFSDDKERKVKIVLKKIDQDHNLRVIYHQAGDIITIVTFYPTKKGRYKNENP